MSADEEWHNLCRICHEPCLPPPMPANTFLTVTVRYEDEVLWGGENDQVHRRCLDANRAIEAAKP